MNPHENDQNIGISLLLRFCTDLKDNGYHMPVRIVLLIVRFLNHRPSSCRVHPAPDNNEQRDRPQKKCGDGDAKCFCNDHITFDPDLSVGCSVQAIAELKRSAKILSSYHNTK